MSTQKEKFEVSETKQTFISKEKFELLKQCQLSILQATEASPTIRKVVNELINEENLQIIKTKFIELWRT